MKSLNDKLINFFTDYLDGKKQDGDEQYFKQKAKVLLDELKTPKIEVETYGVETLVGEIYHYNGDDDNVKRLKKNSIFKAIGQDIQINGMYKETARKEGENEIITIEVKVLKQ